MGSPGASTISFPGPQRCQDESQCPLRPSNSQLGWTGQPHLGWCHLQLHSHHCPGKLAGGSLSHGGRVFGPQSWTLDPWSQTQAPSHHLPHSDRSSRHSSEPRKNVPHDETACLALALALGKVWQGAARGSHSSGPCLNEDRPSCLCGRGREAPVTLSDLLFPGHLSQPSQKPTIQRAYLVPARGPR